MKQTIFQILFGVGLVTAIACAKYDFRQQQPFESNPQMMKLLPYNYSNFRLDFGNERWLAFDSISFNRMLTYNGDNGTPYGFDLDNSNPVTNTDINTAAMWYGGDIPVPLFIYEFDPVSVFSSGGVISNTTDITIGQLTIATGTMWSLSKSLNDEDIATQECCFYTFWVEPQITGVKPRWYFSR